MKISGYSTALYSTFFFLEELGILFDCGDGAAAMLLGKSRKVKHIFISHADRDHLGGLLQFITSVRHSMLYALSQKITFKNC